MDCLILKAWFSQGFKVCPQSAAGIFNLTLKVERASWARRVLKTEKEKEHSTYLLKVLSLDLETPSNLHGHPFLYSWGKLLQPY